MLNEVLQFGSVEDILREVGITEEEFFGEE